MAGYFNGLLNTGNFAGAGQPFDGWVPDPSLPDSPNILARIGAGMMDPVVMARMASMRVMNPSALPAYQQQVADDQRLYQQGIGGDRPDPWRRLGNAAMVAPLYGVAGARAALAGVRAAWGRSIADEYMNQDVRRALARELAAPSNPTGQLQQP